LYSPVAILTLFLVGTRQKHRKGNDIFISQDLGKVRPIGRRLRWLALEELDELKVFPQLPGLLLLRFLIIPPFEPFSIFSSSSSVRLALEGHEPVLFIVLQESHHLQHEPLEIINIDGHHLNALAFAVIDHISFSSGMVARKINF